MNSETVPGSTPTAAELRQAFRNLPQPVAVITGLGRARQPVGMTVSSLTVVSLAPPLVLFCPALGSLAWAAARERGTFAVNILGHEHHRLAVQFAAPGNRFAGARVLAMSDGLPGLAEALTVLLCDVLEERPAGDHTVVLGRVRTIHALHGGTGLDTVSLRDRVTCPPTAILAGR